MSTALRTFVLGIALLLSACATPIGVDGVDTQRAYRRLTANALSAGTPSEWTKQVLHRDSLYDMHNEDPSSALEALHKLLRQEPTSDRLFALAELSFLYADNYDRPSYYMAAMAYAYAFLLPEGEETPLRPSDPRARIAVDLYNISIARGLREPGKDEVRVEPAVYNLPIGVVDLTVDSSQFLWSGYRLTRFYPVGEFVVHGLRNRYRYPGAGAPLAATVEPAGNDAAAEAMRKRIPPRVRVPVTAFVRFKEPLHSLIAGQMQASLEVYASDQTSTVRVGVRDVPLELEPTAALAHGLEGAPVWDSEIAGFRFGEQRLFGDGLFMTRPYRRGRIPVLFVHGTASSPARWAEMFNELDNDPILRDRYQFWFFQYNTGQPILYSAGLMRSAIRSVLEESDPQHADVALRNMVVIGHSQGGLLTKLMTVESGTRFWDNVSQVPIDKLKASAETKAFLQQYLVLEPMPEIGRVIFIATPHRGSFRAGGWISGLMRYIVYLPRRLTADVDPVARELGIDLPTAVDNMSPNNRFVRTLSDLPIDPRIKAHSIVGVPQAGPPDKQDDGVVAYASAHIGGVESELLVRSNHSMQAHPDTIQEVRRILREHLQHTPQAAP